MHIHIHIYIYISTHKTWRGIRRMGGSLGQWRVPIMSIVGHINIYIYIHMFDDVLNWLEYGHVKNKNTLFLWESLWKSHIVSSSGGVVTPDDRWSPAPTSTRLSQLGAWRCSPRPSRPLEIEQFKEGFTILSAQIGIFHWSNQEKFEIHGRKLGLNWQKLESHSQQIEILSANISRATEHEDWTRKSGTHWEKRI